MSGSGEPADPGPGSPVLRGTAITPDRLAGEAPAGAVGDGCRPAPTAISRSALLAPAVDARLGELAAHHGLTDAQRDRLATLLDAIQRNPTAPTSLRAAQRAVDVHIADSLAALKLEPVRRAKLAADIGSGAGLPGLPLAVALPATRFRLVESSTRKCRFLDGLIDDVGTGNAEVICQRVEQWDDGYGTHDLVVARALAPAPVVAEYAAPLLALGGFLVDWRGEVAAEEEARALAAAAILGLRREQVVRSDPLPGADRHYLHLYVKVRDTPQRFPRRPGMARKRPLPA